MKPTLDEWLSATDSRVECSKNEFRSAIHPKFWEQDWRCTPWKVVEEQQRLIRKLREQRDGFMLDPRTKRTKEYFDAELMAELEEGNQ